MSPVQMQRTSTIVSLHGWLESDTLQEISAPAHFVSLLVDTSIDEEDPETGELIHNVGSGNHRLMFVIGAQIRDLLCFIRASRMEGESRVECAAKGWLLTDPEGHSFIVVETITYQVPSEVKAVAKQLIRETKVQPSEPGAIWPAVSPRVKQTR